jgi:DNA-binding LacI/PurR family transcriptional regulator
VIGGGFAGASCARALRAFAPDVAITLVERGRRFTACPFSNAVIAGLRFDAVVATSDSIAAGALRALSEQGIAVPDAVGVVGMDNDLAPFLIPALTSVDFDPGELGFRAVDRLLRVMRGEAAPDVEIIGHRLIPRASTLKRATRVEPAVDRS